MDGYEVVGLNGTFRKNQRINEVIIPEGVEFLGDYTFERCRKLEKINLPSTIMDIGSYNFVYTGISNINLPDNVKIIRGGAFSDCDKLKNIDLSRLKLEKIESNTFAGCVSLEQVILPDTITVIDMLAFGSCQSLKSIKLPNSIIVIEDSAFAGCSTLKGISLPQSLTYIGGGAFSGCNGIEEFIIPNTVSDIGDGFIYGTNLKKIINLSSYDYDKGTFIDSDADYAWYLSESENEIAEYLPANSTIYRRKVELPIDPEEPSNPDVPTKPDNPDTPNDPENPSDDKGKIKIQEIELSITCTKPNENISPENIKVDFKTEYCHVKEINVTRYNKAEIIIAPDEEYYQILSPEISSTALLRKPKMKLPRDSRLKL